MKAFLLSVAAVAMLTAAPASAAIIQYTDRSAFTAAAGTVTIEDFSGFANADLAPSTDLGTFTISTNGTAFVNFAALSIDITADTGGGGPGTVTFTFDTPIFAFGADFSSLNNDSPRTYAVVGGTNFDPLPLSPDFLGFVSDTSFTSVIFANREGFPLNDAFEVDNLTFGGGAIPEPGTWALMIVGLGATGALLRRRRTSTVAMN